MITLVVKNFDFVKCGHIGNIYFKFGEYVFIFDKKYNCFIERGIFCLCITKGFYADMS